MQSGTTIARDYISFATSILSQNHRGIDIAELILVSMKVIIACTKGFPKKDVMGIPLTIWPPGLKSLKIQLDLSQNKHFLPN